MLFENLIHDINARGEFCQELPSMKIGKMYSCEYMELPNFENGNLKLLESKYFGRIKKEGFRTYIKLKDSK